MATGTTPLTPPARKYHHDMVHYISCLINFADGASKVYTVGTIPAGSLILKPLSGVHVTQVYNSGTNNLINIGTTLDDDLYGTVLSLTAANFIPLDETIGGNYVTVETTITASHALTGTAATTGTGVVIVAYAIVNRAL